MDGGPSRTAFGVALMRATHTRVDRPVLFDDPWGDRLVPEEEQAALYRRILADADDDGRARLAALGSRQAAIDAALRAHPTYGGIVIRSRWAEDALAAAVARGVRQYVLLGAGFDSFVARMPAFACDLAIFEIDHPATQAVKRERLAACGIAIPATVRFVAADLAVEPLPAVLARGEFAADVPAFFSWLGVTTYLTRAENHAALRGIATAAVPGSEVAFTYIDQRALDGRSEVVERIRAQLAAAGEPWRSGFDPRTLRAELRDLGLELVEDLDHAAIAARYCADRRDGLHPSRIGHLARARVASTG